MYPLSTGDPLSFSFCLFYSDNWDENMIPNMHVCIVMANTHNLCGVLNVLNGFWSRWVLTHQSHKQYQQGIMGKWHRSTLEKFASSVKEG